MAPSRSTHVRLARAAADLGEEQVDAEGRVLVLEVALDVVNGLLQHLRALTQAANDTDAAGVRDGRSEPRTFCDVHACVRTVSGGRAVLRSGVPVEASIREGWGRV